MRPGVIHHHVHARVEQISHGEAVVQSVIMGESFITAVSNGISIPRVWFSVAVGGTWIAQREVSETRLVGVGDAIEIHAFRAAVFKTPNNLAGELMFHRRVPHVSVGSLYMWV